ncbi:hypothetical protein [Streptomyces sp. NPDC005438]|uniref:hypothetical protein n=1 Tax=Streptomyces sp. NPDC005438 TaxID=3156880 RepID=UPI0033BC852D
MGPRTARAALFTALCLALSSGGHVLLSGSPLPLLPVAAVGAVIFVVAFALAGGERGFASIAGVLVPLELAADTFFTTGQHTCYGEAGGPVAGPLRSVGVDLLCAGGEFGTPLARMTHRGGRDPLADTALPAASPWLLLAAHVSVGLLAAFWLWRGEAALARVVRSAALAAWRPLRLVRASGFARWRPLPPARTPLRRVAPPLPPLTPSVLRRGPPCPAL